MNGSSPGLARAEQDVLAVADDARDGLVDAAGEPAVDALEQRRAAALVTTAEDGDAAAVLLQRAREAFDDGRLARAADGEVAHADDHAAERVVAQETLPVEPESRLHDLAENQREDEQKHPQQRRALAVAALQDHVDGELLQTFDPAAHGGRCIPVDDPRAPVVGAGDDGARAGQPGGGEHGVGDRFRVGQRQAGHRRTAAAQETAQRARRLPGREHLRQERHERQAVRLVKRAVLEAVAQRLVVARGERRRDPARPRAARHGGAARHAFGQDAPGIRRAHLESRGSATRTAALVDRKPERQRAFLAARHREPAELRRARRCPGGLPAPRKSRKLPRGKAVRPRARSARRPCPSATSRCCPSRATWARRPPISQANANGATPARAKNASAASCAIGRGGGIVARG